MAKKAKSVSAREAFSREHFLNRELQALEFNRRVLAQAEDKAVPLLERLRFLCIGSSNLDEFFEIRVSGLKEQIKLGADAMGPDGLTPLQAFRQVSARAQGIVEKQYRLFNDEILPALAKEGIRFLKRASWTAPQQEWIRDYFFREMRPVLTPIGLDPAHPFPRVFNKSLNFAVELEGRDDLPVRLGSQVGIPGDDCDSHAEASPFFSPFKVTVVPRMRVGQSLERGYRPRGAAANRRLSSQESVPMSACA